MTLIQKGISKMFAYRETKLLWYFFICLFLILFSVEQLQAQVAPELEVKIKDALSNRSWTIYHHSYKPDILTFTEDTVLSDNLAEEGYSKYGSSYKVKMGTDGAYIWQAIMLHENQKDMVLLKGELKNGMMTGVIVYQTRDGTSKIGNFTTLPPE